MIRCEECKKYAALHSPRKVDEHNYIYGFCFKDYHVSYGSTYPVYIPDGGVCKAFEKSPKEKKEYEYEIDPTFKCELCKKELLSKINKCLN